MQSSSCACRERRRDERRVHGRVFHPFILHSLTASHAQQQTQAQAQQHRSTQRVTSGTNRPSAPPSAALAPAPALASCFFLPCSCSRSRSRSLLFFIHFPIHSHSHSHSPSPSHSHFHFHFHLLTKVRSYLKVPTNCNIFDERALMTPSHINF